MVTLDEVFVDIYVKRVLTFLNYKSYCMRMFIADYKNMGWEYYKNKYRINTCRIGDYDYSSPGLYYVTICVKDRKNHLCDVFEENGLGWVRLSEIGEYTMRCLLDIPNYFYNA